MTQEYLKGREYAFERCKYAKKNLILIMRDSWIKVGQGLLLYRDDCPKIDFYCGCIDVCNEFLKGVTYHANNY